MMPCSVPSYTHRLLRRACLWATFITTMLCASPSALAHKASDAYLQLSSNQTTLSFQLSLAVRDLDAAIDSLDTDNNRSLEWGEIRQNMPKVQAWVSQGFQVQCGDRALNLPWTFESLEERSDGVYVRLTAASSCSESTLGMNYVLMRNIDATHRLIVAGTVQGQSVAALISPQSKPSLSLPLGAASATPGKTSSWSAGWAAFMQFFPEGLHHLATGYDHLAFLLALLLPIMLHSQRLRTHTSLEAATRDRPGVWALLRTVTGFTIGHSITLLLATLGWISSPGWVEPVIAITIGISALLNVYPVRWLRSDVLALGFGLVHGLGFSNIMREANVSSDLLPWALAGFNLGVEAGQLIGVALWCGVHLVIGRWSRYHQVVVRGGSFALVGLAVYWTAARLSSA
jgi:hypothetical protein